MNVAQRISEIIARGKVIDAAQAELERLAELENEGQFTDEARTQYTTLNDEWATLKAEKDRLEEDAAMRAARNGRALDLQPKAIPRKTEPNAGAPVPGSQPTPVERTEGDDEPQATVRFKIPARAKRFGTTRNFSGVQNGLAPDERAYRFGMWAMAQIQRCIPGYSYPEATRFVNNYMGGVYNVAHSESDGTTGGHFLVPEEFSSDLIVLRERYGVVRRLFGREPMMSDTKHIPKRASGLTAYFTGENQAATESNMSWQDVQLIAKDITCMARMSNQLSADAAISVGDQLAGEIAYAFSNKEDDCGFNGTGSSTYGGIRGIRTLLTDVDGQGTDSAGVITQATSNTWDTMVLSDFNKVVGKCHSTPTPPMPRGCVIGRSTQA
jgi:HK97 family phage major capsid protein